MRLQTGQEALVARVLTKDGKTGFGFSFPLDATEARHMAEWHAGARAEQPAHRAGARPPLGNRVCGGNAATVGLRARVYCFGIFAASTTRVQRFDSLTKNSRSSLGRAGARLDAELGEALLHVAGAASALASSWLHAVDHRRAASSPARPARSTRRRRNLSTPASIAVGTSGSSG